MSDQSQDKAGIKSLMEYAVEAAVRSSGAHSELRSFEPAPPPPPDSKPPEGPRIERAEPTTPSPMANRDEFS